MNRYDLQKQIEQQPEAKLKDLIMKMLFDEIISLKIAPGSRINVNQIASSMGISRNCCRYCLSIVVFVCY